MCYAHVQWLHHWYSFRPWLEYPSCLHTTVASSLLQPSSHTVPHSLFIQISTLPSFWMLPPTSRSLPVVQTAVKWYVQYYVSLLHWLACMLHIMFTKNCRTVDRVLYVPSHLTPASSEWSQLAETRAPLLQVSSWFSLPEQFTSSSTIWPVPWPK